MVRDELGVEKVSRIRIENPYFITGLKHSVTKTAGVSRLESVRIYGSEGKGEVVKLKPVVQTFLPEFGLHVDRSNHATVSIWL
jgi:hypothetical protein